MATYPKIADNEMNYFQFKAKQMVLLKKEDREWQDFCKQIAPECAACVGEKVDSKESKDIGIQASPRKTFNKIERITPVSKYQNGQMEALNNIKTRLEKIDLALSKMYDVSYENVEKKKPAIASTLNEKTLKSLEEERKLLIQKSLKASLQKLHSSSHRTAKKPLPVIKQPSYFIPHDLQVKRAAARKAYLASLQNKPKVSFKNKSQNYKKNVQTSQNKKSVPKHLPKPKLKKKSISKKETKVLEGDKEETLIGATEAEEAKDENIENVVDGILEDLLGEAALDLNKIKQRKRQTESNGVDEVDRLKETAVHPSSLTSSPTRNTKPKVLATEDNTSIMKLKLFLDSSKKAELKIRNLKKEELIDKSTSTFPIEDPKNKPDEMAAKRNIISTFHKRISEIKDPPKFVCGVSKIISLGPDEAKEISENKERFWKYLKRISRRVKGNFNPWVLNEMLAESILDECVQDIAEELSEMPSNFIQHLYNQEFVQQVEG